MHEPDEELRDIAADLANQLGIYGDAERSEWIDFLCVRIRAATEIDYDAAIEVAPPRNFGTVMVTLEYAGMATPTPIIDPD